MNNKVISLFDFGQGNNAPENINDYMGRHVYIYNNVYAVTAVKPSERNVCRRDGSMYSGQALLYVVSVEEYDEQGHRGTWLEAGNIAETGKMVVNWYHDADYKINLSKCGELYAKAIQAEARRISDRENQEKKGQARQAEVKKFYEENTPEWSQAVIYAELRQDDSDSQTDYFSSSSVKKVLLGFSKSKRNGFAELRKFASSYEPTKHLATEGKEHRENYTGGHGYYLGGERGHYSGWIVQKSSYLGTSNIDFSHWLEKNKDTKK